MIALVRAQLLCFGGKPGYKANKEWLNDMKKGMVNDPASFVWACRLTAAKRSSTAKILFTIAIIFCMV
jgi:hypothetical protein